MMLGEDEEEEKSGITTSYYWVWSFFLGLAGQRDLLRTMVLVRLKLGFAVVVC